jgi:hypothetical protein
MENQIGYTSRQELIKELKLRLGDQMVDVELDMDHFHVAINRAVGRYRQLSSGAVEESVMFIQTQPGVVEYTLPAEVMEVRRLYRRGIGTNSGTGSNFDPFDAAFNNMYLLNAGQIGGLTTFDAFSQYKETASRIFGGEYDFLWNRNSRVLKLLRNVRVDEDVAVGVYNFVPEMILLGDVYASDWLASYALAMCKFMLGEARSKYQSGLPGAGGGIILNGEQLKAEATSEMEALKEAVSNFEDGGTPLGFVIG